MLSLYKCIQMIIMLSLFRKWLAQNLSSKLVSLPPGFQIFVLDLTFLNITIVHLHQQLQEVIAKRDDWRSKEHETPEQERERLLTQVKQDNQEIQSLEKRYPAASNPLLIH